MGMEFLSVVAVGILWAVVGVVFSRVARRRADFIGFMALSSLLSAAGAWVFFPRFDHLAEMFSSERDSFLILFLAGICSTVGMTFMNLGMKRGHHGATWTVCQSALVIPVVMGVLLWKDHLRIANTIGLLIVLGSIVLFGNKNEHPKEATGSSAVAWLSVVLLSLAFLGAQQTLTTVPSRWADWRDLTNLRIPALWSGSAIAYNLLALGMRRRVAFGAWREASILCAVSLISSLMLFHTLDIFAASSRAALVYPAAVGTCCIAFSLYSLFVLKEESTRYQIAGMALGCVGVVMVSIR